MRRVMAALSLLAVLVVAPAAVAGGWATVGLSSTPAGTQPGQPWKVELTVLQHGQRPLEGLSPTVTIRSGDATRTFDAVPTKRAGVYAASVVFPTAGKWTYEVNDGFVTGQPHKFPPVEIGAAADIGAPAPAATPATATTVDDGGPNWAWLAPGLAAFALAALVLVARARHDRARHGHQPQAA